MFLLTGGKGRHPERPTSNPTLLQVGCVLQSCKVFAQYHIPESLRQGLKLSETWYCKAIYPAVLHDLDVGTCWRWLPKYPPPHPDQGPIMSPVMWVSPPQLSAMTGQDSAAAPFLLAATLSSLMAFFLSAPFFLSLSFFLKRAIWGRRKTARPRSRRWPDSKALFSKMIKGGKWNRILKCTKTWRAHFFLHSLSGPSGWGI